MSFLQKFRKVVFTVVSFSLIVTVMDALAEFPDRPVDLICNYGPGGGADQFSRALSPILSKQLGVKVQVSNVTGAAGNNGIHRTATSKPDGYTIGTITGLSVSSWLKGHGKLRAKDMTFLAIGQVTDSMLFVPTNSPYKTFKDLLAAAKANPDKIKVAISGRGGADDVTMTYMAGKGYKFRTVPYEKPAERYAAPIGGHVDVMYEEPGDVRQFVKNKQIRPIVVFSNQANRYHPKVPIVTDFGLDVYFQNFRGIITGKDVPKAEKEVLNKALNKAFTSDAFNVFCNKTSTCTNARTVEDSRQFVEKYFKGLEKYSKN
ncbi:MAG: hypothetical protein CFH06_00685 [Alphaproteobacteria bacterium MarineAlpha3_Bin5]|nr:hypothetical protein [Magnetovibrio sp.]PPR78741.1 MAG: hypothetical protein CFH06_00685 [Alphaproteobacteria bacterium MarineAlpha3_Bin5]